MLITPTLSRAVESADARWLQRIANAPQAMACKHRFAALQSKSVIGRHGSYSYTHIHTTMSLLLATSVTAGC
jgi:hypothetical protein